VATLFAVRVHTLSLLPRCYHLGGREQVSPGLAFGFMPVGRRSWTFWGLLRLLLDLIRNQEVGGSIPPRSTKLRTTLRIALLASSLGVSQGPEKRSDRGIFLRRVLGAYGLTFVIAALLLFAVGHLDLFGHPLVAQADGAGGLSGLLRRPGRRRYRTVNPSVGRREAISRTL